MSGEGNANSEDKRAAPTTTPYVPVMVSAVGGVTVNAFRTDAGWGGKGPLDWILSFSNNYTTEQFWVTATSAKGTTSYTCGLSVPGPFASEPAHMAAVNLQTSSPLNQFFFPFTSVGPSGATLSCGTPDAGGPRLGLATTPVFNPPLSMAILGTAAPYNNISLDPGWTYPLAVGDVFASEALIQFQDTTYTCGTSTLTSKMPDIQFFNTRINVHRAPSTPHEL
ncbi:hypothetical protein M231_01815 [Tremella mesenterica]|uniref:Uncharacterized protein n=1 Tax=Tremella mesenterica TaxID=5217 RepID=A0A4V1M4N3_TREME|nr:hypothetical protein M231_01815 [Tremella mesenterica]